MSGPLPAHPGSLGKGPLNGCVCVCVCNRDIKNDPKYRIISSHQCSLNNEQVATQHRLVTGGDIAAVP